MSVLSSPLFKQQCYINGQWMDAQSGETIDVTNPATGSGPWYTTAGAAEESDASLRQRCRDKWGTQGRGALHRSLG